MRVMTSAKMAPEVRLPDGLPSDRSVCQADESVVNKRAASLCPQLRFLSQTATELFPHGAFLCFAIIAETE